MVSKSPRIFSSTVVNFYSISVVFSVLSYSVVPDGNDGIVYAVNVFFVVEFWPHGL